LNFISAAHDFAIDAMTTDIFQRPIVAVGLAGPPAPAGLQRRRGYPPWLADS